MVTLDETERYLAKMCAAGWRPVSISSLGYKFVFARSEPGEYVCTSAATVKRTGFFAGKFDYRRHTEVVALLEEQGATVIPRVTNNNCGGVLAVSRADQGPLEVNSDTASKVADLKARRRLHVVHLLFYLAASLYFLFFTLWSHSYSGALSTTFWLMMLGLWFSWVARYGWAVTRYSREIGRLERNLTAFE